MLCTVVEFKVKLKLSLPRKIEPNYRNHRSFFFPELQSILIIETDNPLIPRSNICMCGRRKIIGRCNINSIRDFVQQIFIKYEFHFCNAERLDEKIDEIGWIVSFSFFSL